MSLFLVARNGFAQSESLMHSLGWKGIVDLKYRGLRSRRVLTPSNKEASRRSLSTSVTP